MKAVEISYSHQVQQALMHACEAAEECRNASVGTEHLLIGILRINEARLTEALKKPQAPLRKTVHNACPYWLWTRPDSHGGGRMVSPSD